MRRADTASLKLPSLVKSHNIVCPCDTEEDISGLFVKLSTFHSRLHDPMKKLLYHSAMYEDDWVGCDGLLSSGSCIERHLINKEPPCEVYHSPPPDHVPLRKRKQSNEKCKYLADHRTIRTSTPMSTVLVRWQRRNENDPRVYYQSVVEQLSDYGSIESVTKVGRQTALVVFNDITSACRAIRAYPGNNPGESIQCYWQHKPIAHYKIKSGTAR